MLSFLRKQESDFMFSHGYYVYIIFDEPYGTLYIGVTNNLGRRMYEHRHKLANGFSAKHNIDKLAYAEHFERIEDAIHREKCLKRWKRDWKMDLIKASNPEWRDLTKDIHI